MKGMAVWGMFVCVLYVCMYVCMYSQMNEGGKS